MTNNSVEIAYVDQGYTGDAQQEAAKEAGIELVVVKLPEVKKGFLLLPKPWVVERRFAWTAHFLAFLILMLPTFIVTIAHRYESV